MPRVVPVLLMAVSWIGVLWPTSAVGDRAPRVVPVVSATGFAGSNQKAFELGIGFRHEVGEVPSLQWGLSAGLGLSLFDDGGDLVPVAKVRADLVGKVGWLGLYGDVNFGVTSGATETPVFGAGGGLVVSVAKLGYEHQRWFRTDNAPQHLFVLRLEVPLDRRDVDDDCSLVESLFGVGCDE